MRYISYYQDKSLINLSNSILKHFGVAPFHKTIPEVDELLKGHKKVAVFLFDGFGKTIREKNLKSLDKSSILSNKFMDISSTFPPTTVAATTGFLTGLYPIENGWTGWSVYMKSVDMVLEMFNGTDFITKKMLLPRNIVKDMYPFTNILDLIHNNNEKIHTEMVTFIPLDDPKTPKNNKEFFEQCDKALTGVEEGFFYCYNIEPDHSMHEEGTNTPHIQQLCKEIDEGIQEIADKHKDTLILVISDHSHIDVEPIYLDEYPAFSECVEGCFSCEGRAAFFRVKPEKSLQFLDEFNKNFAEYFDLLTKQEVIDNHLFGEGNLNQDALDAFGDYFLISVSHKYFEFSKAELLKRNDKPFKAAHGGGTEEENVTCIAVFNK